MPRLVRGAATSFLLRQSVALHMTAWLRLARLGRRGSPRERPARSRGFSQPVRFGWKGAAEACLDVRLEMVDTAQAPLAQRLLLHTTSLLGRRGLLKASPRSLGHRRLLWCAHGGSRTRSSHTWRSSRQRSGPWTRQLHPILYGRRSLRSARDAASAAAFTARSAARSLRQRRWQHLCR